MTPEERAVINAAIKAVRNRSALPDYLRPVKDAARALIYSCQQCNTDTHRCYGCGADVGHGEHTCSDCEAAEPQHDPLSGDLIPAGQDAELARQGREIAEGCNNCAPFLAGVSADRVDGSDLAAPCSDCGEVCLTWVARTAADVRRGDRIRMPGQGGTETTVLDRYQPTTPNASDRGTWHVVPGDRGHWDDHVVQPGECWLLLEGRDKPLNFPPTMLIEILLTPAEAAALDALGWENRS